MTKNLYAPVPMMCFESGCLNDAAPRHKYCYKCRYKHQKEKTPIKRAYFTLRQNCQRKKVDFNLTLEEFTEFCSKNNYIVEKGIYADDYQIARIDKEQGYNKNNIHYIQNKQNAVDTRLLHKSI